MFAKAAFVGGLSDYCAENRQIPSRCTSVSGSESGIPASASCAGSGGGSTFFMDKKVLKLSDHPKAFCDFLENIVTSIDTNAALPAQYEFDMIGEFGLIFGKL